jgi:uncharacterized protein (DUF58 family)
VSDFYLPFVVVILVMAALLQEDYLFTVLYLFAGAYALGRWWSRKAIQSVRVQRTFQPRAFLDEEIPVQLELASTSLLPVVWLRLHESLPVELAVPNFYRQVVSLGPKEQVRLQYSLKARKRGYYRIGPLALSSGDILGLAGTLKMEYPVDYLTVYPRIVPLSKIKLPSHSPMGTLRHHEPIYEDPTRVMGKREYVAGDSLRNVDWKATATTGRMQVKKYEASIALETMIFLNLNSAEYHQKERIHATELAIVVAASIANWVEGKKQSVGLVTNGADPLAVEGRPQPIPPRKGRGHLMRILEVLARVQAAETRPLVELLQHEYLHLPWGTTLILVTGQLDEALFDQLFQARRSGLDAMLVLCGQMSGSREVQRRAATFGFPLYQIEIEQDLDIWR